MKKMIGTLFSMVFWFVVTSSAMSLIMGEGIYRFQWQDLGIIVKVILIMVMSIFIHELGHLIMGFATGYTFTSFQVGNVLWTRDEDKIKFKIEKNTYVLGQCLMKPTENEEDFKFFWYNFGGGLFNLIAMTIGFIIIRRANLTDFWYIFFMIGNTINGFNMLLNLIPLPFLNNDGFNIYSASRSPEAKKGFYQTLILHDALKQGKRYRDFSSEAFKVKEGIRLENFWVATLVLHEFARLEDLGEMDAAMKELNRLDIEKLPNLLKGTAKLELLNHYIMRQPDYEKAKELYRCKSVKQVIKMELPGTIRIKALYEYFINHEKNEAKTLLEKAEKQAETLEAKGWREMELEEVNRLKKVMI